MKKIILLFLCIFSLHANTNFSDNFYKYDTHFQVVAEKYNIPFVLLKAIALSENNEFNPDIKSKNTNETYDYGLMQINTIWLKRYGLSESTILHPRVNIEVAAKILSEIINNKGYSWDAIGRYHSANQKFKSKWLSRVKKNVVYIAKNDTKYRYVLASK